MAHTLLLADDSVTIQRVIELTFADEDVQVVAVSDGDEAIARLNKTPPDIVAKISQAIATTLKLPDVIERYRALASTPVGSSPAETAAFLKKESERWRQVIAAAGIKPE